MSFRRAALLVAVAALARAVAPGAAALGEEPPPAPATPAEDSFLAEAEPLISSEERAIYLALERPYQRTAFARRFWQLRDPYPETAANELLVRWRERLPLARERYGSLADGRARALLLAGEPAQVVRFACAELLREGEAWVYRAADRIPEPFTLVFVAAGADQGGRYRSWSPAEGPASLVFGALLPHGPGGDPLARLAAGCPRGAELAGALAGAHDLDELDRRWGLVPHPGAEWARGFLPLAAGADPAPPLAAELELAFPARRQSRTLVEGTLWLQPPDGSLPGVYALDGEVVREAELFETFRYRFDPPPSALGADGRLPLRFERALRPGGYRLALRLTELASGARFDLERALEVPVVAAAGADPGAAAADPGTAAAGEPGTDEEASIRLLVPADRLVTGRARVEAEARGAAVARVAFLLDGRRVLDKARPPFGVELDFGAAPRPRRVAAVAYDAAGAELARDEVLVNGGPHRFALRLLEPSGLASGAATLPARAEVEVPDGETLDRVEFFVDDRRVATLFQPPFAQALPVPPGATMAWVRAVAYLAGGGAAEDVRLLSGDTPGESVDVDLVELYTTVVDRRGRPVEDLAAGEVRVLESGERQEIRRFERVHDRPMHAGVMLDVSGSMVEELGEAERAALGFFERVLTPRDRAAVFTFADRPRLAARFTGRSEVLAGALAGIEARGETHLYDALAFALHYFTGLSGQRALVLLSDGFDTGSRFRFEEVLDYARRTGVAIYSIGLGVPTNPPDGRRALDLLARETGGRAFYIERASELARVYTAIENEIRSQWLIAYQSSHAGEEYRTVEVELARPGIEARTIRGYYP